MTRQITVSFPKGVVLLENPTQVSDLERQQSLFAHRIVDEGHAVPLYCPYNPATACGQTCALFDAEIEQGSGGQPSKMYVTCRGTRFGRLFVLADQPRSNPSPADPSPGL